MINAVVTSNAVRVSADSPSQEVLMQAFVRGLRPVADMSMPHLQCGINNTSATGPAASIKDLTWTLRACRRT